VTASQQLQLVLRAENIRINTTGHESALLRN